MFTSRRERNEAIGECGKESVPTMTRICSAGTDGVGDEAVRREKLMLPVYGVVFCLVMTS